jgi:diadenosine tetraphosphatase ApaH/serine/threonine PP2A family protein phosphatase
MQKLKVQPPTTSQAAGLEVAKMLIALVTEMANHIHKRQKFNGQANGFVSDTRVNNTEDWNGRNIDAAKFQQRLNLIEEACRVARDIFFRESRVVKVYGPTIVFGDLHGNLADLLLYSRLFWPRMPSLMTSNFVFLGDYVDRGLQSLEVFLYIIAFKIMNPVKVTVLRGNHEVRGTQKGFGFYKECLEKFGDQSGPEIWELLNKVMDCIPVCAVINEQVFAAHGGIPASVKSLDALKGMGRVLSDPERESPAAWEVMWNDPSEKEQMDFMRRQANLGFSSIQKGFIANPKRATAYFYSEEAVDIFCQENKLSHIIRAHELRDQGFSFHFKGKVCTVFSCSFYAGTRNIAAVIQVQGNILTPIQILTSSESPKPTSKDAASSNGSLPGSSMSSDEGVSSLLSKASKTTPKKQQNFKRK